MMDARTGWLQGGLTGLQASQLRTEGPTYRVIFRQTDRQKKRPVSPPTDRQTDRQADEQKPRKTDNKGINSQRLVGPVKQAGNAVQNLHTNSVEIKQTESHICFIYAKKIIDL